MLLRVTASTKIIFSIHPSTDDAFESEPHETRSLVSFTVSGPCRFHYAGKSFSTQIPFPSLSSCIPHRGFHFHHHDNHLHRCSMHRNTHGVNDRRSCTRRTSFPITNDCRQKQAVVTRSNGNVIVTKRRRMRPHLLELRIMRKRALKQ